MYHIKIPTLLMLTTIAVITAMHGLYGQTQQHIDSVNAIVIQGSAKTPQQLEDLLLQNIEDAQTIHYQKGIADGYAKLSLLQYYNGRYEDNVTNMLQAIKIYEGLQLFENVSKSYGELGYQMKRRDFQKGARYMQKAINLAEKNDFHSILKDLYNNYGVLKEMEEQLDSALYYYESSLQLKQQEGDTFGIPYSISNIAGVYRLKNEFDKALENANLALDKRIALNDSIGLAENYTQLAEIFLAQNRLDSAVIYFDKSVLISKRKEYPFLTQYNYQQLADVFKRKNNATKALQYFEAYTKIKDSIQAVSVSEKVANLEIEFETEKKENEILQQRAQLAEKDLEVRRKNTLVYGGFGLALLLGLLGYLFYSQQKLKNRQLQKEAQLQTALSKIETQNKLQEQRLRISRDLHDNIGSQLTFVTSSIDNLQYALEIGNEKVTQKLGDISEFTTQTIYELRDTIWAMNKTQVTAEDLQVRIANFIDKAGKAAEGVTFNFEVDEGVSEKTFTSVEGMNVYRIIQESVNNALKHAQASKISVVMKQSEKGTLVEITDNGVGFNEAEIEAGNGLANIRKRARDIGGKAQIVSENGNGAKITIHF